MGGLLSSSYRRWRSSFSERRVDSPQGRASRPLASGLHGMLPTPRCSSRPNISRSSSRWRREYWFCIEMNGVQPLSSAACCMDANCQAHIDEAPRYLALPAFTTSCSASIVSSIGVSGSKRWIW